MSNEQTNVQVNSEVKAENRLALYVLRSGQGMVHGGITSNMTSEIQLFEDKVKFGIFPKKYNRVPEMRYEDIVSIEITKKYAARYIIFAILTCFTIILPLLFIYLSINNKITIKQSNGAYTEIFSYNKKDGETVAEALDNMVKSKRGASVLSIR